MSHRALIAGCGYLGEILGGILAQRGWEVFGLRRNVDLLPPELRSIQADLTDPTSYPELPDDLDVVFYTAAAKSRESAHYRAIYHDGLRSLLSVLKGQGQKPSRLITTSSTSVYAQQDGSWVDELSEATPAAPCPQILRAAEELAHGSEIPATVVRLSGIYGPCRRGLVDAIRSGRANLSAEPRWTNRIHIEDGAGFLAHLLELTRPAALYLCSDDDPAQQNEVYRWLAKQLGVDEPAIASGGSANKRCRNEKMRRSGYALKYPSYREGYAALLGPR